MDANTHLAITVVLGLLTTISVGLVTWCLKSIVALREGQSELKSDLKAALAVSEERKEENHRRFEELKVEYNRRLEESEKKCDGSYEKLREELRDNTKAIVALHTRLDNRVDGRNIN